MANEDYYSLLGIDRNAPEREVKRAYYNLARDLHPDRAKSPEEARTNAERLAVISKAYNTLKDPAKRAEYDAGNKGRSPGGSPPSPTTTQRPSASPPAASAQGAPAPASAPAGAAPATGGKPPAAPPPAAPTGTSPDQAQQKVLTAQRAFVKGMEFYKAADFKKALPFFETAVANDPRSEAHYHMKLAICLMKTKGSFTRAVEAAEKACEMDAYNMEFKFGLVELYETVGVTTKALQVCEEILKWEPENERAKARLSLLKVTKEAARDRSFLEKMFPSMFKKK